MRYTVELLDEPGAARSISVLLPRLRPGETRQVEVDGQQIQVLLLCEVEGEEVLSIGGKRYPLREVPSPPGEGDSAGVEVRFLHRGFQVRALVSSEIDQLRTRKRGSTSGTAPFTLTSPLPGVVRRVLLRNNSPVEADTPILTLEAMKMENEVRAGRRGQLIELFVEEGQVLNTGDPLAQIRPAGPAGRPEAGTPISPSVSEPKR